MQEFFDESILETAMIVDVDMRTWTLTVGTQYSDRILRNIPWTSPYLHPTAGEGISFVPEVGAQCILCTPSDGENNPFVLAFLPIPKKDSYHSNRIRLSPGDIQLSTRDENFLVLRRGGVVQLGGSPLCQTIYLPMDNIIRSISQGYEIDTFAGSMVWEIDKEKKQDANTGTRMLLVAKDKAGGKNYAPVTMVLGKTLSKEHLFKRMGQSYLEQMGGSSPVVELDITIDGAGKFNLAVDASGNVSARIGGKCDIRMGGDVSVLGSKSVTLNVGQTLTVKASSIKEEATTHEASFSTSVEKCAISKSIQSPSVFLGAGSANQAVKWGQLLRWLGLAKIAVSGTVGTFEPASLASFVICRSQSVKIGD